MFIELEPIFNNIGEKKFFDYQLDLSEVRFNDVFPFKTPVMVKGVVKNETGIVTIDGQADVAYSGVCDRCSEKVNKTFPITIFHSLVTELNDEENDDFYLVEDMHFNLDEIVLEDIFLSLPTKILCKEDCAGICPQCGTNLNDGSCSCKKAMDPRLEILRQLLDD